MTLVLCNKVCLLLIQLCLILLLSIVAVWGIITGPRCDNKIYHLRNIFKGEFMSSIRGVPPIVRPSIKGIAVKELGVARFLENIRQMMQNTHMELIPDK